jgi:hypothetical protein
MTRSILGTTELEAILLFPHPTTRDEQQQAIAKPARQSLALFCMEVVMANRAVRR